MKEKKMFLRYFCASIFCVVMSVQSVQAASPEVLLDIDWQRLEDTVYVEKLKAQALEVLRNHPIQELAPESLPLKAETDLSWQAGDVVSRDTRNAALLFERRFLGRADTQQCQVWLQDFYLSTNQKRSAPYMLDCEQVKEDMDDFADVHYSENGRMVYYSQALAQDFAKNHELMNLGDEQEGERDNRFEMHWYPTGGIKIIAVPKTTYYFSEDEQLVGLDQTRTSTSYEGGTMVAGWYRNGQLRFQGSCYSYPCPEESDRVGLWQEWYDNGQKYRQMEYAGTYEFDVPCYGGEHFTWYKNGQLKTRTLFSDDGLPKEQNWYENGQIVQSCDEKTGLCTSWYENGQVMMQGHIKKYDGYDSFYRTGEWFGYYEDGKPFMHSYYDDIGRKTSVWEFWHHNGQLRYQIKFGQEEDEMSQQYKVHTILHWDENGVAARLPGVPELVDLEETTKRLAGDPQVKDAIDRFHKEASWVSSPSGGLDIAMRLVLGLTSDGYYVVQEFQDNDLGLWGSSREQNADSLNIEKEIEFWNTYSPFTEHNEISPPLSAPYVTTKLPVKIRDEWGHDVWTMPENVKGELVLFYPPDYGSSTEAQAEYPIEETGYDARRDYIFYTPFDSSWWTPPRGMYQRPQKWIQTSYKNGKYHGSWQVWYTNGQPAQQGQYVHGKRDGLWMQWDEFGRKECQVRFENGVANEKSWRFWNALEEEVLVMDEQKTKDITRRFAYSSLFGWRQPLEDKERTEPMRGCFIF